ncbi:MAG: AMMECR1 domain-containing protein [Halobacteria archaeon]
MKLARESMKSYVKSGRRNRPGCMEDEFYNRTGVLVKLQSVRGRNSVRGSAACYKRGKQMSDAIVDAIIEASGGKGGLSEVTEREVGSISITLCLLNELKEVHEDHDSEIDIGTHGVIIENDRDQGWILPTMPVEYGWEVPEFLDRVCCKAGMNKGEWQHDHVTTYAFSGQILRESEPAGQVDELDLQTQMAEP